MKGKYIKMLTIIILVFVIVLIASVSYAFFTASVQENNISTNSVITTGNMEVTYTDGNVIGAASNMIPGDYIEKEFSIRNTGTVDTLYDIYLNEVINTFNTKSDLVYELITSDGRNISETVCPNENVKIASAVPISVGQTHNYTLKIIFKSVNRNQDDNKGKGFSAKIDLVEAENIPKYVAAQLIDYAKVSSDFEYDGVETLGLNGTEDNNLRYVGSNPNNYLYFNCSTANVSEMNDSTCEKWRIIGVFNNIEDYNGNKSSRVKIIREQSLGDYSFDTSDSSINGGWGINQWGSYETYEGADLMRELNTDYLGNITVGTDGKWFSGLNDKKNADIPTSTLNNNAKNMIQEIKWNIGSNGNNENSNWSTKNMYIYERSESTGKTCSSGPNCNDNVDRTTSWKGSVALMYPSDYGYSTSGGVRTSKELCLNTTLYNWGNSDYIDCKNNSWLVPTSDLQWTLSPRAYGYSSASLFVIRSIGDLNNSFAYHVNSVHPTVFLKSNVQIVEGSGSSEKPYKLIMQ